MGIWEANKSEGKLAGCDFTRGEPILPGLFHLVYEVLVRHIDGLYLLTQCDYSKE